MRDGFAPYLQRIDSDVAIAEVNPMQVVVSESLWRPRFAAVLLGFAAALATVLTGAGIYAVFSYSVTRRHQEIGIRMAMGAEAGQIVSLVVWAALRLALAGMAAGLVAVFLLGRFLASQLYGVKLYDPLTLVVVSALVLSVALAACMIPALRASHVDPLIALRRE
jgi:putative ABC transport system permease protein